MSKVDEKLKKLQETVANKKAVVGTLVGLGALGVGTYVYEAHQQEAEAKKIEQKAQEQEEKALRAEADKIAAAEQEKIASDIENIYLKRVIDGENLQAGSFRKKDIEGVKTGLEYGANIINEQDDNGQTYFMKEVLEYQKTKDPKTFEFIRDLLKTGAVDINVADNKGVKPIDVVNTLSGIQGEQLKREMAEAKSSKGFKEPDIKGFIKRMEKAKADNKMYARMSPYVSDEYEYTEFVVLTVDNQDNRKMQLEETNKVGEVKADICGLMLTNRRNDKTISSISFYKDDAKEITPLLKDYFTAQNRAYEKVKGAKLKESKTYDATKDFLGQVKVRSSR